MWDEGSQGGVVPLMAFSESSCKRGQISLFFWACEPCMGRQCCLHHRAPGVSESYLWHGRDANCWPITGNYRDGPSGVWGSLGVPWPLPQHPEETMTHWERVSKHTRQVSLSSSIRLHVWAFTINNNLMVNTVRGCRARQCASQGLSCVIHGTSPRGQDITHVFLIRSWGSERFRDTTQVCLISDPMFFTNT